MRRFVASLFLGLTLVGGAAGSAFAAEPVKTQIWLDGALVRTILPPAATPREGTDDFYMVRLASQGNPVVAGVAAVGPGDTGYHGGHWAVYFATWNVGKMVRPLTSASQILAAEAANEIEIARNAAADFLCPIQGH